MMQTKHEQPYRVLMVGAEVLRGRGAITAEVFLELALGTAVLAGAEVFRRVETVLGRFSRLAPKTLLRGEGKNVTLCQPLVLSYY